MKQGSALSGSMILVSTDCALLIQWSFSNGVPITYGFEIYIYVYIYIERLCILNQECLAGHTLLRGLTGLL